MGQVRTWHADAKDIFNCEQGKKFKGRLLTLEDVYHSIDNQALKNNMKIKSVKLADSVKEIGNQSFYNCTALRDINLENVSQIRWESFLGCVHLKEITLSSGIRYLGRRSFSGCKRLNCVKFEKSTMLKGIEAGVFQNCESIEKISLPKGLTEIGNKAFYKCTSLNRASGRNSGYRKRSFLPDGNSGNKTAVNTCRNRKQCVSQMQVIRIYSDTGICEKNRKVVFSRVQAVEKSGIFGRAGGDRRMDH